MDPSGKRLNMLIMSPKSPRAIKSCESVACPAKATVPAPKLPSTGPPNAINASSHASRGSSLVAMTAPMNGTKTMGENGTPLECITAACPISCTRMRPTMPVAYGRPKNIAYVPTVNSMLPNGASLVNLRAARTYFVLPKRRRAPDPINPAIFPRLRFGALLGGGRGGVGVFWLEKHARELVLEVVGETDAIDDAIDDAIGERRTCC
mmetsp:Transcript_22517/g.48947  ORF Transcript_22517/g.48947 Transcript_22517/m.48947 type:complete len:207 (+) Transcript_22517:609-1229(+)